jgi:hypothetical protein
MMTPEQEKTLEALRVAINDHLSEMGWLSEHKLLSEFVVVSCAETFIPGEDKGNTYYLTQSSTTLPFHHVVGLLHCGLKWQYDEDREEEP